MISSAYGSVIRQNATRHHFGHGQRNLAACVSVVNFGAPVCIPSLNDANLSKCKPKHHHLDKVTKIIQIKERNIMLSRDDKFSTIVL